MCVCVCVCVFVCVRVYVCENWPKNLYVRDAHQAACRRYSLLVMTSLPAGL